MKRVHFLSAADRMNYGDLLFPIIFKKHFHDVLSDHSFYNYGVVQSDHSNFGAMPTLSYKHLVNNARTDNDVVVVGGGGVMFPTWQKLLSLINPTYATLMKRKFVRRMEKRFNIAKRLLTTDDSMSPFLPGVRTRLVYNAVGGHFPDKLSSPAREAVINRLNAAEHISVRDTRTKDSLTQNMIKNVTLVPDSAVIMSDLYKPDGYHMSRLGEQVKSLKKYAVLQVGRYKGPAKMDYLLSGLRKLGKLGYQIVCVPIGTAPGHEDDVILKEIQKQSANCLYYEPKSIYETMQLIGKSDIYMGTSLHGAITAFSFGRPMLLLNRNVKKLQSYSETWWTPIMHGCVDFEQFEESVEAAIVGWDYDSAHRLLTNQKEQVYQNFQKIGATLGMAA